VIEHRAIIFLPVRSDSLPHAYSGLNPCSFEARQYQHWYCEALPALTAVLSHPASRIFRDVSIVGHRCLQITENKSPSARDCLKVEREVDPLSGRFSGGFVVLPLVFLLGFTPFFALACCSA
jgi:hypothetical protein